MEERENMIRGVAHDNNVIKVAVLGVPDRPGVAYKIFSALANQNINVDMIVQSIRTDNKNINDIVFTVAKTELTKTKQIVEDIGRQLQVIDVLIDENVAKVSIVGAGMLGSPGIAAKMFGALASANVNIKVISTSEISIACLISKDQVKEAVNAIHDSFFAMDQI